jgi:hypothetical protein
LNGKNINSGYFDSIEEAPKAYEAKKIELGIDN